MGKVENKISKLLPMAASVWDRVNESARIDQRSRNGQIVILLEEALDARDRKAKNDA